MIIDALVTFAIDMLATWKRDQATINSEFATSEAAWGQTDQEFDEHITRLADISGLTPDVIRERVQACMMERV